MVLQVFAGGGRREHAYVGASGCLVCRAVRWDRTLLGPVKGGQPRRYSDLDPLTSEGTLGRPVRGEHRGLGTVVEVAVNETKRETRLYTRTLRNDGMMDKTCHNSARSTRGSGLTTC